MVWKLHAWTVLKMVNKTFNLQTQSLDNIWGWQTGSQQDLWCWVHSHHFTPHSTPLIHLPANDRWKVMISGSRPHNRLTTAEHYTCYFWFRRLKASFQKKNGRHSSRHWGLRYRQHFVSQATALRRKKCWESSKAVIWKILLKLSMANKLLLFLKASLGEWAIVIDDMCMYVNHVPCF